MTTSSKPTRAVESRTAARRRQAVDERPRISQPTSAPKATISTTDVSAGLPELLRKRGQGSGSHVARTGIGFAPIQRGVCRGQR
jgi:hypothetical protein